MHCHHGGLPPRFLPDEKNGLHPDFKFDGMGYIALVFVTTTRQSVAGEAGLPVLSLECFDAGAWSDESL